VSATVRSFGSPDARLNSKRTSRDGANGDVLQFRKEPQPDLVASTIAPDFALGARGRPVGVAVANGALLAADDVGNLIWRVR
jgi:glucose/arabinose dehydrogenase